MQIKRIDQLDRIGPLGTPSLSEARRIYRSVQQKYDPGSRTYREARKAFMAAQARQEKRDTR